MRIIILVLLFLALLLAPAFGQAQGLPDPIVFVQRQIPPDGSDFMRLSDEDKAMPGAGGRERFRVAAPGRLLVLEPSGTLRTLVDGASPTVASMNLIDVSAPSVSYDGEWILFAGLPAPLPGQTYSTGPFSNPGRWRIFVIRSDGSGLRQITFNDPALDAVNFSQFGGSGPYRYDDTDPVWLPDGRIVFSSTRLLTAGEYGAAPRGTNLHVINADGTGEHRITSERNGADRSVIDPLTGRIAFARWWLNGRFPTDRTDTLLSDNGGYRWFDGLTTQGDATVASGGPGAVDSNDWVMTTVNPDGTDLRLFTGHVRLPQFIMANNCYGGVFAADGSLYGNFFPDLPLTEGSGFGGIRRYRRGALTSSGVWGKVVKDDDFIRKEDPVSLTVMHSANGYAADPAILSDGRLLFSWARDPATGAEDIGQDYGLFIINPSNPSTPTLVYDNRGTTELRAQVLRPRPIPPIIPDTAFERPTPTPISSNSQISRDGEFIFDALNVYANGPVDMQIVNAPAIGSATKIRFFADYQRNPMSADMYLNFPVKLMEVLLPPSGAVRQPSPANVPLFEDLRHDNGKLPLTTSGYSFSGVNGGAFVTGFNSGRPGTVVRCVGCHAGHSMIPVPATDEEAQWSNLAPGATGPSALRDRKSSTSSTFSTANLTFPVNVKVRRVRLWGNGSQANVKLYSDTGLTQQVGSASGTSQTGGADVAFAEQIARVVRVELTSGTSLQEVEVIASGNTDATPPPPPSACADGADNDSDGLIDLADPGCSSASDTDEFNEPPPPPPTVCADGLDNDGDGLIDFPADPGCVSATDTDEFNAPPPPAVPVLSSISVTPSSVTFGQSSQGAVSLSGPAPSGGVTVALTSSDPSIASVPSSIRVEQGISGQSFQVMTNSNPPKRKRSYSITITATANGVSKSVSLKVSR